MKVLIVGMGSIGKRHFDNFKSLGCEVAVLSRRELERYTVFQSMEKAVEGFKPSHVVVSNETAEHGKTLLEALSFSEIKNILVEKPLYSDLPSTTPARSEIVSVAYNLRFHPMVSELKEILKDQRIINWHSYVGQYLPTWRPGRDYKDIYSSSRAAGGGALRDLSHELDLFAFFGGELNLKSATGGHFSNLETDADDTYSLLLSGSQCPHGNIHMNCLDRLVQRYITVTTNEHTYHVDLIQGKWRDSQGESLRTFDRNQSYLDMSKAFLENDPRLCSFKEGWMINSIIQKAEAYS